jgi:ribosomal protein L37AE/L43A
MRQYSRSTRKRPCQFSRVLTKIAVVLERNFPEGRFKKYGAKVHEYAKEKEAMMEGKIFCPFCRTMLNLVEVKVYECSKCNIVMPLTLIMRIAVETVLKTTEQKQS